MSSLGISVALRPMGGNSPLEIHGAPGAATQGLAYSFVPIISGGTPPYTVTKTAGSFPSGLSITNPATGATTGTPSGTGTSSGITYHVVDSASPTPATADLTGVAFVVTAPLAITNSAAFTASVGVGYSFTPTTSGGRAPITWACTNKPAWAAFNASTGALTGTPSGAEVDSGILITGTDADGRTASYGAFTITVSSVAVASYVTGFEVLGDVLVNNTTLGANSVSLPSNGWVARVSTNLTVSTCDPTQLVLSVTDYGWASDGSQTTRSRTITGTGRLVKGTPDYTFTDLDQAAGTVDITLDQQIYNDPAADVSARTYQTAIIGVSFGANFINSSAAGAIPVAVTITRSDSHLYPLPIVNCLEYPLQRMDSSNSILLEWGALHEWAQNGAQLACVEAWARQGGVDGTLTRASVMTDSRWTADGLAPSGFHAPVFSTAVSGGAFTDGACTVRARFKPWIGPCMNSYDTGIGDTGVSQNLLADWPFTKDTAGKYSPLYVWVNADGTGLAGTTFNTSTVLSTTTDPGSANSYATMAAAELALKNANNSGTFRSSTHADTAGGVIMLRDVVGSTAGANAGCYSVRAAMGQTIGVIPLEIRAASGTTSQLCRLRGINQDGSASASHGAPKQIVCRNIYFDGQNTANTAASNCIFDFANAPGTAPQASWNLAVALVLINCYSQANSFSPATNGTVFARNQLMWEYRYHADTYEGSPGTFTSFGGTVISVGSLCTGNGATTIPQSGYFGCWMRGCLSGNQTNTNVNVPTTKSILYYNVRQDDTSSAQLSSWANSRTRTQQLIGVGWCGYLLWRGGTAAVGSYVIDNDGQLPSVKNFVIQHFSQPSGSDTNYRANTRGNVFYNDAGAVRIDKEGCVRFSAIAAWANKEGGFNDLHTDSGLAATAFSSGTQYYQGDIVWDPATGSNTVSTSNIYAALHDSISVALSDTTKWLSLGVRANAAYGARPRRVGNWRFRHMVNCMASLNGGSVQGNASDHTPSVNSWLTILSCPQTPAGGWGNTDMTTGLFANDTCGTAATLGTPGDYTPSSSSPLRNRVPAGFAVDPFDMFGTARPNDGTGSAGAIQYH